MRALPPVLIFGGHSARPARSHSHGIGHLHFTRGSFTSYFNSRLKCLLIQKEGLYLIRSYVGSCFLSQSCGHEVSIPYYSAITFLGLVLVSRGWARSIHSSFPSDVSRKLWLLVYLRLLSLLRTHPNGFLRRTRRHGTRTPFLSKAPYTSTLSSRWKIQRTRIWPPSCPTSLWTVQAGEHKRHSQIDASECPTSGTFLCSISYSVLLEIAEDGVLLCKKAAVLMHSPQEIFGTPLACSMARPCKTPPGVDSFFRTPHSAAEYEHTTAHLWFLSSGAWNQRPLTRILRRSSDLNLLIWRFYWFSKLSIY